VIQVCSRCGTRWNVRDRQRQWCPRCRGALLPPYAMQPWVAAPPQRPGPPPRHAPPPTQRPRGRPPVPAGFRWIAVRPGSGPPPRRRRLPLGPTPRYAFIPRWGLIDPATQMPPAETQSQRQGPSLRAVRAMLIVTILTLGVAALLHVARYALLIVNRQVLLNSVIAGLATWLAVAASVAAIFAVVGWAFVLTEWLIARRAAAFGYYYERDPRRVQAMRVGCLLPVVNLFWSLTYIVELAVAEDKYRRLRRLIWSWWALFVLSTAVSIFASATSFPGNTQGIANNTLAFIVAYMLTMAAVVVLDRLVYAFDSAPVERPAHRWLVVADDKQQPAESPAAVEREAEEPAA
jgi:hypothetical protein